MNDGKLRQVVEQYHDLLATTDLDKVLEVYSADALIVSSRGEFYFGDDHPDRGKVVIHLFWSEFIDYPSKKAVLDTIELEVYGQMAYELSRYHLAYSGEDGVKIEEGKYLAVWRYRDDHWKIGVQTFSSKDEPLTGL